ncbi:DgyrCDS7011 [Dimorphilus gyrociliatus]|uniref:DgyrCDS7011 n=1 Tax=Dimorphilus gyrociliatus TaxID=2664684 RepID=A0A7I8VUQ3_9ANNE|nr:DgyrCDS7011 [Dimorphilus gyrociliatus]
MTSKNEYELPSEDLGIAQTSSKYQRDEIQKAAQDLSIDALKTAAEDIRVETGFVVTTSSSSTSRRSTPFERDTDDKSNTGEMENAWKIKTSDSSAFERLSGAGSSPFASHVDYIPPQERSQYSYQKEKNFENYEKKNPSSYFSTKDEPDLINFDGMNDLPLSRVTNDAQYKADSGLCSTNSEKKQSSESSKSGTVLNDSGLQYEDMSSEKTPPRTRYTDDLFISVSNISNNSSQLSSPMHATNRSETSTSYKDLPNQLKNSTMLDSDSDRTSISDEIVSEDVKRILRKFGNKSTDSSYSVSVPMGSSNTTRTTLPTSPNQLRNSRYSSLEKDLHDIENGLAAFQSPRYSDSFSSNYLNQTSVSETLSDLIKKESPPRQAYGYLQEAEIVERSTRKSPPPSELSSIHLTPLSREPFSAFGTAHSVLTRQLDRMRYESPMRNSKSSEVYSPSREYNLSHAFSDPTLLSERVRFLTERERQLREQEEMLRKQKEKDAIEMRNLQETLDRERDEAYRKKLEIERQIEEDSTLEERDSFEKKSNCSNSFRSEKSDKHSNSSYEKSASSSAILIAREKEREYAEKKRRELEMKENELSLKLDLEADNLRHKRVEDGERKGDTLSEHTLSPSPSSSPSRQISARSPHSEHQDRPSARSIKSDTAKAPSDTTIESTHPGSDDFRPPSLPHWAYGTRRDPAPSEGIYSKPQAQTEEQLGTIFEQSDANDDLNRSIKDTEKWLNGHFESNTNENNANENLSIVEDELSSALPDESKAKDEEIERIAARSYQSLHNDDKTDTPTFSRLYATTSQDFTSDDRTWSVPKERKSFGEIDKKTPTSESSWHQYRDLPSNINFQRSVSSRPDSETTQRARRAVATALDASNKVDDILIRGEDEEVYSPTTERLLRLLNQSRSALEFNNKHFTYSKPEELNERDPIKMSEEKNVNKSNYQSTTLSLDEQDLLRQMEPSRRSDVGAERHSESSEQSERSDVEIILNPAGRNSKRRLDIYCNGTTSQDSGSTLTSIPEDSTLESSVTHSSDRQKNLPDDPKLLKLHSKIRRQKEKLLRGRYMEQKRKEKISKLEKLAAEAIEKDESTTVSTDSALRTTDSSTMVEDSDLSEKKTKYKESYERIPSRHPPTKTMTKRPAAAVRRPAVPAPTTLRLKQVDYSKKSTRKNSSPTAKKVPSSKGKRDVGVNVPSPISLNEKAVQTVMEKSVQTSPVRTKNKRDENKENFTNNHPSSIDSIWKYSTSTSNERPFISVPEKVTSSSKPKVNYSTKSNHSTRHRPSTAWTIDQPATFKRNTSQAWFIATESPKYSKRKTLSESKKSNLNNFEDVDLLNKLRRSLKIDQKGTLQDAFERQKRRTISNIEERRKCVRLRAEERRIETVRAGERGELFWEPAESDRKRDACFDPRFDRLFRPRKRCVSLKEARERSAKLYKTLPEITEKQLEERRRAEAKRNKLRAQIFKQKVLNRLLNKKGAWVTKY